MSSPLAEIATVYSVDSDNLRHYLTDMTPALALMQLSVNLLVGDERAHLRTHIDGTASLLLSYKGYEGALLGLDDSASPDLIVSQLQGADSRKSYRVTKGLDWVRLFADEARRIATHELSPFVRLVMRAPYAIPGLNDELAEIASEKSRTRDGDEKFKRFIQRAGLFYSEEEKLYVRDLV